MMKHLIGKQVLDLNISPSADAFKLQHQFSQFYRNKIVPELDSLFDQLSTEEELVRIDRLEIDLGQFTEEGLLQEGFLEQLRQQLEIQLRDFLRGKESDVINRLPTRHNVFEQWLFFLSKGYLPWSSRNLQADWAISILNTLGENRKATLSLQQLLRSQPVALHRLIVQHATVFLKTLIELFTGKKQDTLLKAAAELQKLPGTYWQRTSMKNFSPVNPRQISLVFWKETIESAIVLDHKQDAPTLIRRFLGGFFSAPDLREIQENENEPDYPVLFAAIGQASPLERRQTPDIRKPKDAPLEAQQEAALHPERTSSDFYEEKEEERKEETSPELEVTADGPIEGQTEQQSLEDPPTTELTESTFPFEIDLQEAYLQDRAQLENEEFLLENVGIVLLHPFLTSIFRKLEYLNGSAFKGEAVRHRAIHLLHFLATGELDVPEYSLLLPKMLCGLPFNIPLDHTLQPSQQEQQEAEGLLRAVIAHWAVLKNTSPNGLREGFLQRDGKLFQDAGGWYLQVENNTLDILLNQLPWGIGVIKLPWMMDMLRVEWG